MYKQRSPYNKKKSTSYTMSTCIRCGSEYYKMNIDNECMCQDCKIKDTVDRMTKRIKFQ